MDSDPSPHEECQGDQSWNFDWQDIALPVALGAGVLLAAAVGWWWKNNSQNPSIPPKIENPEISEFHSPHPPDPMPLDPDLSSMEFFPEDLWQLIFDLARLQKLSVLNLLPLRTVCHTWNKIICLFPEVNTEHITNLSRIPQIFALQSLTFGTHTQTLPDLSLLTGLHTLQIDDQTFGFATIGKYSENLQEFSGLTNLTKLTISSNFIISLGPLTFLQCLHLKKPFVIGMDEVKRLSHLTSLISNSKIFKRWSYTGHGSHIGEKRRYVGFYKDGFKEGYGHSFSKNGDKYEGQFHRDKKSGVGVTFYANGDRVEGIFKDGKRHGQGITFYKNGNRYEGNYAKDRRDGYGVFCSSIGDRFEGVWKNGKREGPGTKYYANRTKFEGTFKNDKREGHGVYTYANGDKYEGNFRNDKKNGHGIKTYPNGSRYEGNYKDDRKSGEGIFYFQNGDRHEGTFRGKRNGFGVTYYEDGSRFEGMFKNDKKEGPGKKYYSNGDLFVGKYVNGSQSGFGIDHYANGSRFEGIFGEDGPGTFFCEDGTRWEGTFINKSVSMNGPGVIYFPDGRIFNAIWTEGKIEGVGVMTMPDGRKLEGTFGYSQWSSEQTPGDTPKMITKEQSEATEEGVSCDEDEEEVSRSGSAGSSSSQNNRKRSLGLRPGGDHEASRLTHIPLPVHQEGPIMAPIDNNVPVLHVNQEIKDLIQPYLDTYAFI